jgi:hypothetical protein
MNRPVSLDLRALALTVAMCAVLALGGCATPRSVTHAPGSASAADTPAAPRSVTIDPAVERRILALDPEHITENDVRTTLALGPTPHIILVHGGVYGTHLLMMNFGKFLIGMGYPGQSITNPSDGTYSFSCYESAEKIAGVMAWYYERDGLRPMLTGHSQGGIQTVKILYELDGAFTTQIAVWNPVNDAPEERFTIVDPLTGAQRPVVGLSVGYASVVGAGGMAFWSPFHWSMASRLHLIPNTVEDFTGFNIDFDLIALTGAGAARITTTAPRKSATYRCRRPTATYRAAHASARE